MKSGDGLAVRELVMRLLLWLMPWYDEQVVVAREKRAAAHRAEAIAALESYKRARRGSR